MKYDDERVEKLPQWAKKLIADLTRAADEARSELDRRRDEQPETDVWIEHGYKREDRQYISDQYTLTSSHIPVIFRLPASAEAPDDENTISVRINNGSLEVSATGYPHALTIRAQASNVVHIRSER